MSALKMLRAVVMEEEKAAEALASIRRGPRLKSLKVMQDDLAAVLTALDGDGPGLKSVELLLENLGLDAAYQVLVAPAPRAVASERVVIGPHGEGLYDGVHVGRGRGRGGKRKWRKRNE